MSQLKLFVVVLFICMGLTNCSSGDSSRYQKEFYEKQQAFEELVVALKNDSPNAERIGRSLRAEDMNSKLNNMLNELGIKEVVFNYSHCQDIPAINLSTSWSGKVNLVKDPCDIEQTKKGFHGKAAGGTVDIWGLGDGWLLWIDGDFI